MFSPRRRGVALLQDGEAARSAVTIVPVIGAIRRAPSPLNGERAGVRGEDRFGTRIDKQLAKRFRLSVSQLGPIL